MRLRRSANVVDAALDEALSQPGCPVCRLVERSTARFFDSLLWELVNDPGVRQELRDSLGLCPRHWWELVHVERTRTHNVLGLAILLHDVVQAMGQALQQWAAAGGERRSRRTVVSGRNRLALRPHGCPACRQATSAEAAYVQRLVERYEALGGGGDPDAAAREAGGLCTAHAGAALTRRGSLGRPLAGWPVEVVAGAEPASLLPRPRVSRPRSRDLPGADGGAEASPCGVCSALARGAEVAPRGAGDALSPTGCVPVGRGATLCTAHVSAEADPTPWLEAARRARASGKVYTLRCVRCEQEAALQREHLAGAQGPLCFPHLTQMAEPPAAVVEPTARWAADLVQRLAGFIRKQDWHVDEPLTEPERTSVREATLFVAGAYVVTE